MTEEGEFEKCDGGLNWAFVEINFLVAKRSLFALAAMSQKGWDPKLVSFDGAKWSLLE